MLRFKVACGNVHIANHGWGFARFHIV